MGDINFTIEERAFIEQVIHKGLLQPLGNASPFWWVMRLALAKSLTMTGDPSDAAFDRVPAVKGGSELHLQQVVGSPGKEAGRDAGPDADLSDSFRFLLSTRHQADYFSDNTAFIEVLGRHLRRGLKELKASWRDGSDFHDLLLDDIYFDAGPDAAAAAADGARSAGPVTLTRLMAGLKQIGVKTDAGESSTEGPRLTRFELPLASIEDYERLRRGLDDLSFTMGLGDSALALTRSAGERRVLIDIPRPVATWRSVHWADLSESLTGRAEILPVCIGTDVLGAPFVFDLAEAPHLFVGGTTGSGKSVCLNAILMSALGAAKPPQLVLIDPKGLDFAGYEKSRQLLTGSVTTDAAAAVPILDRLVDEMEARSQQFRALGVRVLAEAQAKGSDLRRILVVIDEVADLFMQHKEIERPLVRLAQKSRSSGIHLVLATQRPDAVTFPGLLRSNIPSRIALTVQKAADSRIILDESGAEALLMRGDMLVKLAGRGTLRAHGALISERDIAAAVERRR